MPEKISWGILGAATIARVCVIPAIEKSHNGIVHALASRFPDRTAELIKNRNIRKLYGSYDEVLNDPAIDAVYIPLPNHLHHEWTLKALNAGKHVLCEKPLACSAKEAREMVETAEKTHRLLMEAFMYRFHPRSQHIKQLIDEGTIGLPCLIRTAFCYHMGEEVLMRGENYRLKPEMGGGALLDVGCYGVSVARWLFAEEPDQVQAQAVFNHNGVDIHVAGLLRFPHDRLATIEASFCSALQQTYSVVGSDGAIDLPHDAFIPWEHDAEFTVRARNQERGQAHVVAGADEYQLMIEHFANVVRGTEKSAIPPAESISNMRVLDALAEAAKTGTSIRVIVHD